jgi:Kef-type K+ transport system membrane component KefB
MSFHFFLRLAGRKTAKQKKNEQNIRLAIALLLQVAIATELFAVLENIGVFSAGTLATHHSQNITTPRMLPKLLDFYGNYFVAVEASFFIKLKPYQNIKASLSVRSVFGVVADSLR